MVFNIQRCKTWFLLAFVSSPNKIKLWLYLSRAWRLYNLIMSLIVWEVVLTYGVIMRGNLAVSDLCLVLLACPVTLYKILVIRWLLPPSQPLCVLSRVLPLLFRSGILTSNNTVRQSKGREGFV